MMEPSAPGPLSRQLLLSLYLPAMAISLGQSIIIPALPVYAKSFEVSFGVASLVIVLHGLGTVVATLPTGYLIDRVGRRPVLLIGPLLTALTSFATAFAGSFPELLIYRFLGGCASQAWELSRLTMIADTGGVRERGRMITWMFEMQRVSMLLAPAVGGFVAAWDIRAPFIIHGLLTLLAIWPSLTLTQETDPARQAGARATHGAEPSWRFVFAQLAHAEMSAFMVAQFMANVARGVTQAGAINLYVAYAFNAGPVTIGVLNTGTSLATLPIGFTTGPIMDRWGRKKTIVPGFSLLFIGMLVVGATALLQSPFEVFVAAFVFMNLADSITGGNMQVLGADLAPPRARGRFFGAWRLIGRGGSALSPAIFGYVAETAGYAVGFAVLGLASLSVALIVGLLIAETVGRGEPRPTPASS